MKYQAGVGPNMTALHIYKLDVVDPRNRLSLCELTNIARNYKGPVSIKNVNLCKRCFRKLQNTLSSGAGITAEMIGVQTLED
jgi:hypothetical protein